MKSPKFLSIIDNFFFVAVLLPVLGWGFLIIFFKYLPNAVSREDLNLLWGYSVPLFFVAFGIEIFAVTALWFQKVTVFRKDESNVYHILGISELNKILPTGSILQKALICSVIFSIPCMTFSFGWFLFGGMIKYIALNHY